MTQPEWIAQSGTAIIEGPQPYETPEMRHRRYAELSAYEVDRFSVFTGEWTTFERPGGRQLVYRRRTALRWDIKEGPLGTELAILVAWEFPRLDIEGRVSTTIGYVWREDTDWQEFAGYGGNLLHPPQLFDCEVQRA